MGVLERHAATGSGLLVYAKSTVGVHHAPRSHIAWSPKAPPLRLALRRLMPPPRAHLRIVDRPTESEREAFRNRFDALSPEDQFELFRADPDGVSRMTRRPDGTCFGVQVIRPYLDGPALVDGPGRA